MHARYLSIILLCSYTNLQAPIQQEHTETERHLITINAGEGPITVPVTVEIKPNIEPHNLFQPGNTIHTTSQGFGGIAQSSSNATNTTMNVIKLRIAQTVQMIKTISPRTIGKSAAQWTKLHKKQILLYSIGTGYFLISAILIHGNLFMQKRTTWATWKKHLSLEELLEIPHDQLGRELIIAIEQRHVNIQNPTDHLTPLVRFIQEIGKEMKIINRYLLIASIIRRCHLMRIFPTNNQKIERAQELKQRLAFIKHTFISWTATDNLANFNH